MLHCCQPEPAFTQNGSADTRGKTIIWTLSPSTGHQETNTFTSLFSCLNDQLLLLLCFYSHALVCRARGWTHVHYSSLPANRQYRWRFHDLKMTAEMVWDEEEPFERLTLKMLLFFCLFCQAFTSLQVIRSTQPQTCSHCTRFHCCVLLLCRHSVRFFGVKNYSLVLWCNYRYVQICRKCKRDFYNCCRVCTDYECVCVQYTGSQVYSTTILLASTP